MNSIFRNILVWVVLGSLLIYVFDNIENSTAREMALNLKQSTQYLRKMMLLIELSKKMELSQSMKKLNSHLYGHSF